MVSGVYSDFEYSERRIDRGVLFGAGLCAALMAFGVLQGQNLVNYLNPGGLLIVLGGTFGATLVHFSPRDMQHAWESFRRVLFEPSHHVEERIHVLVEMAQAVRHHGVLYLERQVRQPSDPFFQMALELTVDGQSSEEIRRILETETRSSNDRMGRAVQVFSTMGTYAPAMGLIGTLCGLVQMLGALDNPSAVGPAMSVALLTTLYGAVIANVIFLPVAGKIKNAAEGQSLMKAITIEGVISLGKQENPIIVEQRLRGFLPLGTRDE